MTRRDRARGRRGNAMIEFALAFGVTAPLLFGAFQFGYAFYTYNKLENAVRAGARYASLRTYDSASATPSAAYASAVRNMVLCGDPAGGKPPVVPGLTADKVTLAVTMASNVPQTVAVGIDNYSINAVFATFTWRGKPAAIFRYMGRLAP